MRGMEVVSALGKRVRGYGVVLRLMHLWACGKEGALVVGGRGPWRERERERRWSRVAARDLPGVFGSII